ncbi:ribosome biogenesis GTPase Der [Psychromonas sp. Urea-02u-13]|uniref:ribosome biogenesis GTPase Der n=1 Tax=Psychromonas sp. Urea-02u-13 TaxID=2058326 RepID=UPI000C3246E5|nr:ribosome biogenesis GTPase Der [Psychromonas sp. Urea-02u-13]PKG40415.1 ribosome biogenesis GTPase Der [Psychromonas sp. Urea-02u-13]
MLPVIALVGRPNVGKSTLFNRLTRTRDALVADFPGLTRDRKYGQAKIDEDEFIVIDTGGITGDEEGLDAVMAEQSLMAIDEADAVLFMVDARVGMMVADQAIADHLRKQEKKVFIVANKTDGIDADSACAEFYGLGLGEVYHIAAAHGKGVRQMIDTALDGFFEAPVEGELDDEEFFAQDEYIEDDEEKLLKEQERLAAMPIKLAIIGKPNVGKSTLINRILGEERVVVFDQPGTTRDSIYIPMTRDEREYILIDTAGVRKRKKVNETIEKFSVIKTLQAIEDANTVLLVIDARDGIAEQDLCLLGYTLNAGRSLVIAVNKWDGMTDYDKERVKSELDRRLGFIDFAKIHFISALHGTGVGHLYESIEEAYDSSTKRISTSMLTRIMTMATDDHNPPMVQSRRVKLRYAHAGGYNPPLIVIHGNQVKKLPHSYKRYLMNYFRRSLKIMGTPIRIEFREGSNPFEGRRQKLTPNQLHKRKRMMSHHTKKK